MKGKFRNKIIGSCMVIVCLVAILFVKGILTEASDTTTEEIQLVTITDYTSSALEEAISNQRANNYLYAGLYKSGTTKDTLVAKNVVIESKVTEGSTYVAKFLPEGVMGIKAQVSEALLSNPEATTSSVRFVTAVDSVLYKEVGFSITREGDTEGADPIQLVKEGTISKYVYEKLYGVDVTSANPGEPLEYTPKDIHALANYFKTYTITNVPETAYNKDLTVTPYWITYDGVTVEGTTGIKSVNFGRSWVYINTSANTDGDQYGTYDHPYTDLADALNAIVLDKSGKIVIQSSCAGATFSVPSGFEWKDHGKDLTITGEGEKAETLDFSGIQSLKIGDGVTFANMTLNLYGSSDSNAGAVYAQGNRFEISDSAECDSPYTKIYGGGSGTSCSETHVTLLSGTYQSVYGGGRGRNATVQGDTNVILRNANVYSTTGENTQRYVCGGGRDGDVKGNTHVTIGEGFNSGLGDDWNSHSYLSGVFGGGFATSDTNAAVVYGNTYVIVETDARANYVHGAGSNYSEVKGTSHVTFDGGYAMCIYGGGSSKQISNGNTYVEMKSGTVEQIFGGNQNGMIGNADVHILGGNILRRVYAGCYNEYEVDWNSSHAVTGYTSVTFGPDTYASLATEYDNSDTWYTDGDATYYAVSRSENNYSSDEGGEIGVFVLNDYDATNNPNSNMVGYTKDASYISSLKPYHYFVQSTTGGAVYSEGDSIRVVPDENKVATVRVGNAGENKGTVHAYLTSEGVCKLPTYDSSATVQNVFVVFTDNAPSDVKVSEYVATADGTHYRTLEEAVNVANTLSTTTGKQVVVNLLKENITVDNTLNIVKSAKIKIQNAKGVTATVNRADGLMSSNLLKVEKGAELSVMNVILDGRKTDQLTVTDIEQVEAGSASLINVSGDLIIDGTTIQYAKNACEGAAIYVNSGNVTMNAGSVSNNYAASGSGGAVSLNNSATFTMKAKTITMEDGTIIKETGTISNNTAADGSGGAFMVRTNSKLTIENGTISGNKATVSGTNGGGAIFAHYNTTVDITGGTFDNNKASSGNGGAILAFSNDKGSSNITIKNATISNNGSQNGGAVYVVAGAELTLEGGATFSNNTATANGGALAVFGTVTENEGTSSTFTGNQAVNGGAIYVSGTFTMKGANIDGNTASGDEKAYGGGVYTTGDGIFTMTGGSITANTAKTNGSGVYVGATGENAVFDMSGGTISEHGTETAKNTVAGNAVYVAANASFIMSGTADISSNYSTQQGNGVYVLKGGSFTMKGGTIQDNHTTDTGSGVSAYGSFTMTEGTIKDNTAGKSAGGVIIRDTGSFSMTNGTIGDNTASGNGGGLYIQTKTTEKVDISGGIIEKNKATLGGGIYVGSNDNDNSINIISKMSGTVSIQGNTATKGAGVYIEKGTLEMSGGSVKNHGTSENPSEAEGAGVYIAKTHGKFNLKGKGTVCNNYTTGNGAGVAAYGTFNMSGTSTIQDNTTTGDGGGVYVANGVTYTMNHDATISGNQANNGGGVAIIGTFNFKKGNITNNTATVNGGGTYVDGGTFKMTDTVSNERTISANAAKKAGAGVYVNDGAFTMSGGTIEGNLLPTTGTVYGAGVYLNAGTFDMSGGSICNHGVGSDTKVTTRGAEEGAGVCAAGTSVVTMTDGSISNNYVSGSGAGVAVRNTAQFILSDNGIISNNTAEKSGGAMIVRSTRKDTVEGQEVLASGFVMNGGTISNNHALSDYQNGGGAIWQAKNTQIELNGGAIAQNTSAYHGGGVYVSADTAFLLKETTFTGNSASECGDDIYLAGEITLKQALSDTIVVGPSTYAVGQVIAVNGGITEDEFKASMEKIIVDAYKGEYWSVNDNGALEAPIVLDGVSYANLDEALENVAEESTITIYQDQELSSPVTVDGTLTITCVDNVSITASENFSGNMFTVAEGGKLVVTGNEEDKNITLSGANVAKFVIQSDGTLELTHAVVNNAAQQGVRINKGTAALDGLNIKNFGSYGLVVKNGIVTVKNTIIDNEELKSTAKMVGIAAHGGTLSLDNVEIRNVVGNQGDHGIEHIAGQLIITANETTDGDNKGLYIYNVSGHGVSSNIEEGKSGNLNIATITIDQCERAGIQLTNNQSDDNIVLEAYITNCNYPIQIKNSKLTIGTTPIEETKGNATTYKTDGTKK